AEQVIGALAQPAQPGQPPRITQQQLETISDSWAQLERASSAQERTRLVNAILAAIPDQASRTQLQTILQKRDQVFGAQFLQNLYQFNQIHNKLTDETNQDALVRWSAAEALLAGGDRNAAQQMFLQAWDKFLQRNRTNMGPVVDTAISFLRAAT